MVEPMPLAVVLVGPIAVGKTTLAERLAEELPATLVSADRLRRELIERLDYTVDSDRTVYTAVIERSVEALGDGRHIVCDATNLERRRREKLENAIGDAADLVYVVLVARDEAVLERLEGRDPAIPRSVGVHRDWWHVYEDLRLRFEPVSSPHLLVDSAEPFDPVIRLLSRLAAGSRQPIQGVPG